MSLSAVLQEIQCTGTGSAAICNKERLHFVSCVFSISQYRTATDRKWAGGYQMILTEDLKLYCF
jgi:hypothetical protein